MKIILKKRKMHSRSNSNVSWSRHSLRYSSENVHTIAATATATGTGTTPASRVYTTPNATHLANSSPSLPPSFTVSPQVAQSPRSPSLLPPPFYSSVRSKLGENSRRSSLTSIGSLSTPTVTTLHTTTTTTTTTSSNKSESETLVRPQRFYLKSNAHNTTVHSPLTLTRSQQQQQQQQQKYKLQRTVSHSSSSSRHDEPYTGTVTVAIRIKPNVTANNPRGSHQRQQHSQAWHRTSSNTIAHDELGSFTFDHVFDHTVQNTDIYTTIAVPLLQSLFTGYNATLFAYGMTGSGKTYTMMGDNMGLAPDGIVPLSVSYMFATIAKLRSDSEELRRYDVFVSYLEIYNEKVYDLLDTGSFSSRSTRTLSRSSSINSQMSSYTQTKTKAQVAQLPVLNVRDDPKNGVKVIGLTEQRCESQEEVLSWIESGDSNRKRGQTDYNTRSSRSHAIIMLKLVTTDLADGSQASSTLSLCDLAGSERYTGQAERRKEGAFINKSLLTLGTVISKLSAMSNGANNHMVNVKPALKSPMRVTSGGSGGTTTNSSGIRVGSSSSSSSSSSPSISHIPYRDSKLTRILQPALSGNSIVATICTVDPSEEMVADTLNTLRFGSRAKNISLRVMKRSVLGTTEDERNLQLIRNLRAQIEEQNKIIEELKRGQMAASVMEPIGAEFVGNGSGGSSSGSDSHTHGSLDERVQSSQDPNINLLQAENTLLKQKLRHCENLLDRDTIELQDPEVVEIVEMLPFEVGSMLEVKFQNIESQLRQYKNYTHKLEGRLMSLDQAGQPIKRDDVDRDQCMNQVNGLHVSDEDYQSRLDAKDRQIEELEKLLERKDKMIEAFQSLRSLQERVLRPLDSNKVSQMMT